MSTPVTLLPHSKFISARRRINIALVTLEDGYFDLLTSNDVVWLLNAALEDLDEAHLVEQGRDEAIKGLDWNAYGPVTE
jgi:hypothetical protein